MGDIPFRLGTFADTAGTFVGVEIDDAVVRLSELSRASSIFIQAASVDDLLAEWGRAFDQLQAAVAIARSKGLDGAASNGLRYLPPILRPSKRLYAAANYRDHVAGMRKTFTSNLPPANDSKAPPLRPYLFVKACAQTGAFDDIILPAGIARTDWEAELAVVIGRTGRNIPEAKVGDHIAGYMTTNDVSCRDLTWREDRPTIRSDWLSGKSFDSFAPMGPWFTPKAFVPDHANLAIRLWVNGVMKQDGNSKDMIFNIEDQVSYASAMMTLQPGDTFATGTPAGTGQERLEFLKAGDIVETEVEHCGRQRNRVVAAKPGYAA